MDEQLKILLHSHQNIKSINVDVFNKIELVNNLSEITEYDIRNAISATDIFDAEREANQVYRIYGRIEFMSILNGLKNNYSAFPDFFLPQNSNSKNILNSFDFYLVRPAESGYTHIITGSSTNNSTITYNRYFKVIATPNQFELFPIGFSNNVFGEQSYSYNFNVDIDVSNYYDQFGFPLTELFIYAQYKKSVSPQEKLAAKQWSNTGIVTKPYINTKSLVIGDYVQSLNGQKFGDIIDYSKLEYLQVQLHPEQFYIETPYISGGTQRLVWKYNPYIPIRLRYLTDSLYEVNISGTSYSKVQSIPYYATSADTAGNYVWRYIMPEGYRDPITGIGTDYPFVNKRRYLFTSIVLDISPDLDDMPTYNAFSEVWYNRNAYNLNTVPLTDINNIGKPCL